VRHKNSRNRRRRSEAGSTLVEFALTAMLFLLVLFAILDFGRALYTYHFVSHAAREATRYAAVRGYTCDTDSSCSVSNPDSGPAAPGNTVIQDYVNTLVPPGLDPSQVSVTPSWPVQSAASSDPSPPICSGAVSGLSATALPNYPGCTVEVTVSYPFSFLVPLIHRGTLTMSSTSEMVIAH
jgi:Flp pilus assembly protein TadG